MLLVHLATLAGLASASVIPHQQRAEASCTDPVQRIEWRNLTSDTKQSYIDAVLCLKTKPSRIGLNTTLFDDFAYVHMKYNPYIHNVAAFLPWHRYFTHVYEGALQECGYTGSATYWDWTQDVKKLAQSPVMATTLGFGGDGSDTRTESVEGDTLRCVDNGPFANLRPSYRGINPTVYVQEDHCLFRDLIDGETQDSRTLATVYNETYVGIVQSNTDFDKYHVALEGGPHGVIHSALGGEMNPATSPNEPLFFLHHSQIDRLWWLWQQVDVTARESDYTGPMIAVNTTTRVSASLDDVLHMGGLADDLTVRDVMTTKSSIFCYKY